MSWLTTTARTTVSKLRIQDDPFFKVASSLQVSVCFVPLLRALDDALKGFPFFLVLCLELLLLFMSTWVPVFPDVYLLSTRHYCLVDSFMSTSELTQTTPEHKSTFVSDCSPCVSKLWERLWRLVQCEARLHKTDDASKGEDQYTKHDDAELSSLHADLARLLDSSSLIEGVCGSPRTQINKLGAIIMSEAYGTWANSSNRIELSQLVIDEQRFPIWLLHAFLAFSEQRVESAYYYLQCLTLALQDRSDVDIPRCVPKA